MASFGDIRVTRKGLFSRRFRVQPRGQDGLGAIVVDEATNWGELIKRARDPRPVFRTHRAFHTDPENFEKPERVAGYRGEFPGWPANPDKRGRRRVHSRAKVTRRSLQITSTRPFHPRETETWLSRLLQQLADWLTTAKVP